MCRTGPAAGRGLVIVVCLGLAFAFNLGLRLGLSCLFGLLRGFHLGILAFPG